ncbi:DNA gyrase inhibitor YacG [Parasulfuritortus cantonensis]|uniref:DNA gyrase inhibitor YacG n=1 Tax=Parasulfuritortus cantonensis TaxID=2528202 RepID=A0A4R1BE71_9PROT|nr:DNA gyrase inhibitor YacG [Parasulfuritortus cantonensis]TCJ15400.1 DNA gyrase inhibitor YacG [Parasulfuritortus cantonensis]
MSEKKIKTVACPTCGKPVEWRPENTYRPFCSERCKLIDLGEWAAEQYRVPAEEGGSGDPSDNGRG